MNLDTYDDPGDLYLTRGDDVNPNRPLFTGDVLQDVEIPGVQESGMAVVLAHPCSFRVGQGRLAERVLVASVREMQRPGRNAWTRGYLNRTPLPDLDGPGFWAGYFDDLGKALSEELLSTRRTACASQAGINLIQQRLTCHLTRAGIPTFQFNQAFSHTYDEADLLEEWSDVLVDASYTVANAIAAFENFIRSGTPSLQQKLVDPQQRSTVRRACKDEASRLATTS